METENETLIEEIRQLISYIDSEAELNIILKLVQAKKNIIANRNIIVKQLNKRCYCGSMFNDITCNSCGFDASEVDIY